MELVTLAITILVSLMAINLAWALHDLSQGRRFDVYAFPEQSTLLRRIRNVFFLAFMLIAFDFWVTKQLSRSTLPGSLYAWVLFDNVVSVAYRLMGRVGRRSE
jgi:hypothetical protein